MTLIVTDPVRTLNTHSPGHQLGRHANRDAKSDDPPAALPTQSPRLSTRGQVMFAIARMRKVPISQVHPSDPVVPKLLSLRAWVVDWIALRYDHNVHGNLTAGALDRVQFDLEYENVFGPAVDNFL